MAIELISRTPNSVENDSTEKPHLLFIHGAFHNAKCWDEYYLPWFAAQGWHAHALSLSGHKSDDPLKMNWSLIDYLNDVNEVITRLDQPVVLVGHSMGGVLTQMALATNENVKGAVLLASSPLRIHFKVAMRILIHSPLAFLIGSLTNDMIKLRSAMEGFFFSDKLQAPLRDKFRRQLVSESPAAVKGVFARQASEFPENDKRPVLVIAGKDDWSIPLADHKRDGLIYRTNPQVCAGAHDLMLDPEWLDSAETIHAWLQKKF